MKNLTLKAPIIYHHKSFLLLLFFTFSSLLNAQTRIISSGSVIINMGIIPQTYGNALKPYGLVYNFLTVQKVPVIWSINPTKIKDGIDFTVDGIDFKGGPFIIENQFASVPIVQAAIALFVAQGVVVHTTLSEVTVPIYQEMNENPNWVMDNDNGSVTANYISNAGIPSSAYRTSLPTSLGYCDDLFILPHADPTWETHGKLFQWNDSYANGGNQGWIWEACNSVSVSEGLSNPSNPSQKLNFLSNDPIPGLIIYNSHASSSNFPFIYSNPQSPYMQFMGILDGATKNGLEKVYLPSRLGGWRSSTTVSVWDPNQIDFLNGDSPGKAAIIAYGFGFGDVNRGKVMYEAGHSHNINSQDGIAAQRAMLNFSFDSPQGKSPKIMSINSVATIVCGSNSIGLSITATSPSNSPLFYQWSSSCNGTFSNATSINTNFLIPASSTQINCIISVVVTDACGRRAFKSYPITIQPNIPPEVTATQTNVMCNGGATGSINITVTGLAPFTFLWTGNGVNTTSEDQINLTADIYTVKVTSENGCSTTSIFTITQPINALSVSASQIPIACFGSQTGAINLIVSGGNPTYTYFWVGNGVEAPLKDQANIGAGDYSVLVTDSNGCQQSLSTSLNNGDGISPVVSVPLNESFQGCLLAISIPYSTSETSISLATFNQLGGIFIDSSTISNITYQDTSTGNCPVIISRTFRVTDICGNTGSAIQTISNFDTTLPTASNPADISISGCNGTFSSPNTAEVSDASDSCSMPIVTFVNDSEPTISGCSETTIRTYKVTDACGNFINVSQNLIRIIDTTLPNFTASIPANVSVSCDEIPIAATITAIDNCGSATVEFTESRINGNCNSNYILTRKWKATDSCGNFNIATQEITVSDTKTPTIIGTFDTTLNINCDQVPPIPSLQFTDNCSGVGTIISPTAVVLSNQTPNGYSIIREWNVSDLCGNSHIFTQKINVTIQDSFTVLQEQACNGDASEINLNNLIPINSIGLGTWTDSNTGMAITNGIFTPLGVLLGEHSFEYKISDLFCPRKIQILMNVNDDCLVLACGNIIVHNAFSPNNDGLNEIFIIENLENKACYPTNKVEIYNRWGVLIYETEEYDNNVIAFKGISEGRTTIKKSDELSSGTYYYILNFTDDQGKKHNKDGYLYLSR